VRNARGIAALVDSEFAKRNKARTLCALWHSRTWRSVSWKSEGSFDGGHKINEAVLP
jgi:hypothetical protein